MATQLIAPVTGSQAMVHVRFAGHSSYLFISCPRVERWPDRRSGLNRSKAIIA